MTVVTYTSIIEYFCSPSRNDVSGCRSPSRIAIAPKRFVRRSP
jgi:hypothetical protein